MNIILVSAVSNLYLAFKKKVYFSCDGSTDINSYIITDIELGVHRAACKCDFCCLTVNMIIITHEE